MFLTKNPFSDHGPDKQGLSESFKYHIPEDIPANERTAFHGAAAAAAKAGKKNFNFGGKTHPVTMKKDLARKIADQKESVGKTAGDKSYFHLQRAKELAKKDGHDYDKLPQYSRTDNKHKDHYHDMAKKESVKKESTMTFREKLVALYEGDRAAHYKGATEPEGMHDKSKSSKGAMDMLNVPKSTEADGMKAAKDTAANIQKSAPGKKLRKGDQNKGDLAIKPSATPVKDPSAKTQTAEEVDKLRVSMSGKTMSQLLDAVNQVTQEGSIKGSGTDRKAVLKKAFRAGEDDTRRFYSGNKPTVKPPKGMRDLKKFDAKHKDKGIQKAFAGGRAAGDGDETIKGKARMKPQSNLPLNKYQRQGIKIDKKDKADTAAYLARTKGK